MMQFLCGTTIILMTVNHFLPIIIVDMKYLFTFTPLLRTLHEEREQNFLLKLVKMCLMHISIDNDEYRDEN